MWYLELGLPAFKRKITYLALGFQAPSLHRGTLPTPMTKESSHLCMLRPMAAVRIPKLHWILKTFK